jgi:murein DD-endopeptidase MepM/ murein hydrolase activator NlpD
VELFGGYDVGCCKKVDLSFLEKHTEKPIPGLKLLIKKNGILHQKVKSDDNGYVMPMHGFAAGDMLEVYVEKFAGGLKKIGEVIIGGSDVNLIFFSPKIKAVANAELHKGDAQARNEIAPSQKTEKEKKAVDVLDKISAAWLNWNFDLNESKAGNSASEKRDSSNKGNSIEQAGQDRHANVKTERSTRGHPKAVVEKPVSPPPPAPSAAMQKIIPNLLFPLEKRPSDSYKDGARRFGANRSQGRKHAGIDLYAPVGTPIRAMADGVVIQKYAFYLGTWVVEVDHGDFIARYGEVQPLTILVKRGQKIQRGQTIAHVGKLKGLSYSMLHLEMYGTNESPVEKGRGLTQKAKAPFQRREDLIDPTGSIDLAKME